VTNINFFLPFSFSFFFTLCLLNFLRKQSTATTKTAAAAAEKATLLFSRGFLPPKLGTDSVVAVAFFREGSFLFPAVAQIYTMRGEPLLSLRPLSLRPSRAPLPPPPPPRRPRPLPARGN